MWYCNSSHLELPSVQPKLNSATGCKQNLVLGQSYVGSCAKQFRNRLESSSHVGKTNCFAKTEHVGTVPGITQLLSRDWTLSVIHVKSSIKCINKKSVYYSSKNNHVDKDFVNLFYFHVDNTFVFLGFHWHVRRRIIFLISPASFAFSLPFGQNVSVEGWTVPKSLASTEICGMQSPNLRSVWQLSNYIRLKKKVILCTCCCMIMSLVRNT